MNRYPFFSSIVLQRTTQNKNTFPYAAPDRDSIMIMLHRVHRAACTIRLQAAAAVYRNKHHLCVIIYQHFLLVLMLVKELF
ncbi:hypothetical protein B5X24_HaOG214915 [Helicoverpa armigera]|nr:hypothetical protein B5X24_HaOG214915 [Helicoverpa armigera]